MPIRNGSYREGAPLMYSTRNPSIGLCFVRFRLIRDLLKAPPSPMTLQVGEITDKLKRWPCVVSGHGMTGHDFG